MKLQRLYKMDTFQERKWVNILKDNNQFTIYKKKIMILFNYFKIWFPREIKGYKSN